MEDLVRRRRSCLGFKSGHTLRLKPVRTLHDDRTFVEMLGGKKADS